jgi:hypothetical protein
MCTCWNVWDQHKGVKYMVFKGGSISSKLASGQDAAAALEPRFGKCKCKSNIIKLGA